MNKIFLGLGILATSMAMVSCSQDDFDNTVNNPTDDGSRFYTQLTISLPTAGSRAADNSGSIAGVEIGQEGENKINTLTIVLMDKISEGKYQVVAKTNVTSVTVPSSTKPTYQAIFNGTAIKNYYASNPALDEYKLQMFVVANDETLSLTEDFNPSTYNPTESTFNTTMLFGYDKDRSLIMSGAPYEVTLPKTAAALMQYDNSSRPYNLTSGGAVEVERSIARFDYKSVKEDDKYDILDNNGNVIGKIQLLDMAVVNERTNTYHFGRVSDNGLNSYFNFELVAGQTTKQFVVSPEADALDSRTFFSTLSSSVTEATAMNQTKGYVWTSIADLTKEDNDDSWNKPNTKGDYKIWRYVSENTIPGSNNQLQKYSTGVVFRAKLLDNSIPGYGNGSLYLFQNVLYGNFAALKEAATKMNGANLANPVLNHYFKQVWGDDAEAAVENNFAVDTKGVTQTPKMHGFTVYKNQSNTSDPLYYTYYYYWNRHEDNGQPNVMGDMEFAVVRNNVYKLAVNSINRFGHTTDDTDDPDPIDPNDPDEKEKIYFKVDVTVMPWTVRVNNIDF